MNMAYGGATLICIYSDENVIQVKTIVLKKNLSRSTINTRHVAVWVFIRSQAMSRAESTVGTLRSPAPVVK